MNGVTRQLGLQAQISTHFLQRLGEVLSDEPRASLLSAFAEAGVDFDRYQRHPENWVQTDLYSLLHVLNQPRYFPGVALKFGISREILDLGVLGYTVLSCRDIAQAMKVLNRYHSLTAGAYQMTLTVEGGRVFSRQWIKPGHGLNRVEIDEEHITGIWRVLTFLLPRAVDMTAVSVHLGFPEPVYGDLYRKCFSGELLFDQKVTSVSFPREWLELPIQTADEVVEQACSNQCDRMMEKLSYGSGVVDDVRRILLSAPRNRNVGVEAVAASMMLTVRSFERRLQAEGTSFRYIDNEVKMGLAEEYLRLGYLSGKEIAYLLNYAQSSTFYRAFKNWFGMTPKAFRKTMG